MQPSRVQYPFETGSELGITSQKPLHRAWERDEALVQQWLKKEYPGIEWRNNKELTSILAMPPTSVPVTLPGAPGVKKAKRPLSRPPALAMA